MSKRYFTVRHADGTESRRSTENRNYPYAVEVVRNNHATAHRMKRTEVPELYSEAAEYEQAIQAITDSDPDDGSPWVVEVQHRGRMLGARHAMYVIAPKGTRHHSTGRIYITSWNEGEEAPELHSVVARLEVYRRDAFERARGREAYAVSLLEGPRLEYGVERWSSRYDLAAKRRDQLLDGSYYDVRVVETVETDRKGEAL